MITNTDMILKAIIVEDEQASRETLENYIAKYCPDVQVVATADSVETGLAAIQKHHPDLIFLDIEMPYGNGFDLLERVEDIDFETVFVTAYSNYAVKALNFSASYYILKPIDIDELIAAVNKVKASREKNENSVQSKILVENLQNIDKQNQKVVLPLIDGFEVVRVKDIIRCQSDDNFTIFYFRERKKQMICRSLKFYEELLADYDFLRVHKSHLINIQYVKKYVKGKGGQVIMADDSEVELSPNKKKEFLARFS